MAATEKRGDWYWIDFRFNGQRFRLPLKTKNETVATNVVGGVERTLMLLEQQAMQIPAGADVAAFVLSNGRNVIMPHEDTPVRHDITLEELKTKYLETLSIGVVEKSTLGTIKTIWATSSRFSVAISSSGGFR